MKGLVIKNPWLWCTAWDSAYAPLIRACRQRWWATQPSVPQVGPWPWETARGAVVAVASLTGVCGAAMGGPLDRCSPWAFPAAYHWQWEGIRLLAEPVPVLGWQGLRDLPAGVEAAVREQLAVAA